MSAEKLNLWGKTGCELPSGGLCTSCCEALQINLSGFAEGPYKPGFSPCPHETPDCSGCNREGDTKPYHCQQYFCDQSNEFTRLTLIAQALNASKVTPDEALTAAQTLFPDRTTENLQKMLNSASDNLKHKYQPRELFYIEQP